MLVRPMAGGDLAAVTALCAQLGYPASTEQVARRFDRIASDPEAALFVAQAPEGRVLGWVYVRGVALMEADGCAEIWGLVVEAGARRQGVGAALMRRAEAWAAERGYTQMGLRSNTIRAEAHRFYEGIGYRIAKTSHVFHKALEG